MSVRIPVVYNEGTHRTATPEETLQRIRPLLPEMGITRVADITGLDRLGIPTWCAVRPSSRSIQVANGKGINHITARVSAIMESVEQWHAEFPEKPFRKASAEELRREGEAFVPANELPERKAVFLSDRRAVNWVWGEQLPNLEPVWLPACTAFLAEPYLVTWGTNGLASGNHLVEATLHALYEVIERDAMAHVTRGALSFPKGESRVIDLDTLPRGPVSILRDRLRQAEVHLTLVRVESLAPVWTFWAVLTDPASPFSCSYVSVGHGSHLCPEVAAVRAITEAAQSRLTVIHGSREDLGGKAYEFNQDLDCVRTFFERQAGDLGWNVMVDHSSNDLRQDLQNVLEGLCRAGYTKVYRINMTNSRFGIPVVKILVPGLERFTF